MYLVNTDGTQLNYLCDTSLLIVSNIHACKLLFSKKLEKSIEKKSEKNKKLVEINQKLDYIKQ